MDVAGEEDRGLFGRVREDGRGGGGGAGGERGGGEGGRRKEEEDEERKVVEKEEGRGGRKVWEKGHCEEKEGRAVEGEEEEARKARRGKHPFEGRGAGRLCEGGELEIPGREVSRYCVRWGGVVAA